MDYAIGDVQGCFKTLVALLNKIKFNPDRDRIYFLGDVVNRGSNSLEVLRLIYSNRDNMKMVLGNHDFHLLVCALTSRKTNKKDTFSEILNANDKVSLLDYLLKRPLFIEYRGALLVHAGIPPQWNKFDLRKNADIVHKKLQSHGISDFLIKMYGNEPTLWSNNLTTEESCRYTINALMRMRFCKNNGELEFDHKEIKNTPQGYKPWFYHKNRILKDTHIFFGHWSTLKGIASKNVYPIDHGCIWGGHLTAIRMKDKIHFSQRSIESL